MRTFLSLLLAALPAAAQFSGLATDDTGSRVWFSSALRQRGATTQATTPKIFTADAHGTVQLAAEAPAGDPYSLLTAPEVSSDGTVLAYQAGYNCPVQTVCRVDEYHHGIVGLKGVRRVEVGTIHMSRNGRYLLREGYTYFGPTGQVELIDVTANRRQPIAVADWNSLAGRRVTADGSALIYADGQLWLARMDGSTQVVPTANLPAPVRSPFFLYLPSATVDDAGRNVVYQATTNTCEIDLTSPSSTAQAAAVVTSDRPCSLQTLSADGTTVLFLSTANFDGSNAAGLMQAWTLDVASKAVKAATHDTAGIAEATLSGDGQVLWAATLAGRILRIDRSTETAQEIVPQTVVIDQDLLSFPLTTAPGALARLAGRGLASQAAASGLPLTDSLGGVRVLVDANRAGAGTLPLVSVSPAEIVFQVPWEMQGRHMLTLAGAESPFEEVLSRELLIQDSAPQFWYSADGYPAIAHEDFRGLVSDRDPARPDEVLHLFLTGLGPVTPVVATGQASPADPLSRLAVPIHVFWQGSLPTNFPVAVDVLFAGMAPGLVGLQQVDLRVPHVAPTQLGVGVSTTGSGTAAYFSVSQY
jgi:uncharacterized protein (TIGR03437 family)